MTIDEFLEAPLVYISRASGIDEGNLSRYLRGKPVTEKTVRRLAKALDMEPHKAFEAILLRRQKSCKNLQACANLN